MVEEIMIKGRSVKSDSFLFKFIQNYENKPINKVFIGFIASKKMFPTAVERNRARRRGKAALRRALGGTPAPLLFPVGAAFLLNKTSLDIDFNGFASEIKQILIKSGILIKQ